MAQILGKDGQESSASQTRQDALADADHLAILHAIWTAETSPAKDQRYRQLLTAALPPGYAYEPGGHREKWLWRTLRAAELAGLDPAEVLTAAVAERDLGGARDIPAVIDARIRRRHGTLVPLPAPAWSRPVPETGDPERDAHLIQVAALMDARKERIGEHAAAASLPWATASLGQVLNDPAARRSAEPEPEGHGSTSALDLEETSRLIDDLAARHREFTGKLAERQSVMIPAEDPDSEPLAPAFTAWAAPARDAILQPPQTPDRAVGTNPGTRPDRDTDMDIEPGG
jgi:hypothetical protein